MAISDRDQRIGMYFNSDEEIFGDFESETNSTNFDETRNSRRKNNMQWLPNTSKEFDKKMVEGAYNANDRGFLEELAKQMAKEQAAANRNRQQTEISANMDLNMTDSLLGEQSKTPELVVRDDKKSKEPTLGQGLAVSGVVGGLVTAAVMIGSSILGKDKPSTVVPENPNPEPTGQIDPNPQNINDTVSSNPEPTNENEVNPNTGNDADNIAPTPQIATQVLTPEASRTPKPVESSEFDVEVSDLNTTRMADLHTGKAFTYQGVTFEIGENLEFDMENLDGEKFLLYMVGILSDPKLKIFENGRLVDAGSGNIHRIEFRKEGSDPNATVYREFDNLGISDTSLQFDNANKETKEVIYFNNTFFGLVNSSPNKNKLDNMLSVNAIRGIALTYGKDINMISVSDAVGSANLIQTSSE